MPVWQMLWRDVGNLEALAAVAAVSGSLSRLFHRRLAAARGGPALVPAVVADAVTAAAAIALVAAAVGRGM